MKINVTKSEAILFSERNPKTKMNIILNKHKIDNHLTVKYLGGYLDKELNFS